MRIDSLPEGPPTVAYTKRFAYGASGELLYEGMARSQSGPETTAPVWAIKRYYYSGGMSEAHWANGTSAETNIWDNRESLTYTSQVTTPVFTYYVDPSASNDLGDGRSEVTAWKTVSKVNATTLTPGQSVGFKRGGTWREQLTVPSSGTAGNPITFGAYGSGSKPVISGANALSGWIPDSGSYTAQDSFGQTPNGSLPLGATAKPWMAGRFVPASNYTLTRVAVQLKKQTGSPFTSPVTAYIYNDSSGSPGTALATATATIQPLLGASYATYYFDFSGLAVSSGTSYWVVLNTTVDNLNYCSWGQQSGATGNLTKYSANGTTWTLANANYQASIVTYYSAAALPNVWAASSIPASGNVRVVLFNGEYGRRKATKAELAAPLDWFYQANTVYVYSSTSPTLVEASTRDYGVNMAGRNWIVLDGLAFVGANSAGIEVSGTTSDFSNNSILNCTSSSSGYFGIHANGPITVTNLLISGSSTDHNGSTGINISTPSPNTNSNGLVIRNSTSYRDGIVAYSFDEGSQVYWYPGGIHLFGINGSLIEGNTVSYAGVRDDGLIPNQAIGTKVTGDGIWLDTCRGTSLANGSIVRNNVTHHNGQHGLFNEKSAYNTWAYNVDYASCAGASGVCGALQADMDTGGGSGNFITGNLFAHNTIYGSHRSGILTQGDYSSVAGSNTGNVFSNNLSIGSADAAFVARFGGENDGVDGHNNVYNYNGFGPQAAGFIAWGYNSYDTYAAWGSLNGPFLGMLLSDPLFANAASGDFTLQSGSPAKAAGTYIAGVSTVNPPNIGAK